MTKTLRLLHTSDWHLGRLLYGRKRYVEFAAFLDWLLDTLRAEGIDVLLVAGDIFDTTTPSNTAQKLYYRFLQRVADTGCRHVIVIGGNHDSPTFLDAPAELLKMLDVHVVGAATADPAAEVIALRDPEGNVELLACAVPYALEGLLRRELDAAGATLLTATHGSLVTLTFRLPASAAAALVARLNEAGQGRLAWVDAP